MPTYNICTRCSATISTHASSLIGICSQCRSQTGWSHCKGCSNQTIPPNGTPCPVCAAARAAAPGHAICKGCGSSFGGNPHKAETSTGMCGSCRKKMGWKCCGSCSNYTVSPGTTSCLVCNSSATPKTTSKVPFKVKCMDDGGMQGLTEGNTYTVVEETENAEGDLTYRLDGIPGRMFRRYRFVVVEETKPPTRTLDLSDWKVWRDHGLQPGECVCKIPRTQCDYHRDT